MQPADIEVIKEIPGYKVILKAVLKFQIQQLVGQLSEHTGEDSLLLTASVADGSLSHLGSESGKVFLDSHDDIKTQFLGFCLNRHHRQKQIEKEKEEEREREKERQSLLEASNRIMRVPTTPTRYGTGMRPRFTPTRMQVSPRQQQFSTRFQTSPRQSVVSPGQGRINSAPRMQSVPLSGTSPQGAQRVGLGNMRHEPYPQARPKRTSLNFNQQGRGPNPNSDVPPKQPTSTMRLPTEPQKNQKINIDPNEVIKIEAPDDEDDVEIVTEKTKPKQLENNIAKQPEVTGPPQTTAPKQPVRTITETAIKIASVTGASETNSEKSVTTDPVPSGATQTSEIPEVSEAPTLSSVSSAPSLPDTPALAVPSNINMPVLSPIPQDETSNSSESTISNAPISVKVSDIAPVEGLSLASDLSKLTGIPAQNENVKMENKKSDNASTSSTASTLIAGISQEDDLGVDPTVSVKVEAVNQSGMGLEITGMTPEQMTQGQGASNVQNMMEVGPSTSGMTGMRDGVGNQMNPEYSMLMRKFNQASQYIASVFGENTSAIADLSALQTGYQHSVDQHSSITEGSGNLKSEMERKALFSGSFSLPPHLFPLYMTKAASPESVQPGMGVLNPEKTNQRATKDSDMSNLADNNSEVLAQSMSDLERLFLANSGVFSHSSEMFQTKSREAPVVDDRWICGECGKRLQTKFALEMHQRTHTGEKPYACDICGMRFNVKGNMKRHKLTHFDKSEFNVE